MQQQLTAAVTKAWFAGDTAEITDLLKRSLSTFEQTDLDSTAFKRLLYEMCWCAVKGEVTAKSLTSVFAASESNFPATALGDVLWLLGMEVEHAEVEDDKRSSDEWENLCKLIKEVVSEKLASEDVLKSVLEPKVLQDGGLTEDAEKFKKKIVKANTKNLYTQQKYNLLSEESEGYAKLLTLLCELNDDNVECSICDMQSLIGYFELDPNRVFDLVLDSFELRTDAASHLKLINLFRRTNLAHILGFKFQFYHGLSDATPDSLYCVTALMIASDHITLEELHPHLWPSPAAMSTSFKERQKAVLKKASSVGVVSLNSKNPEEKAAIAKAEEQKLAEAAVNDLKNQRLGMLQGLLRVRCWKWAKVLFEQLASMGVNACLYMPVAKVLSDLIHSTTRSNDRNHFGAVCDGSLESVENWEQFGPTVWSLLKHLKFQLSSDVMLLVKLCRLLKQLFLENIQIWENEETRAPLKSILVEAIFPALSRIPPNPGVVYEIWEAMKLLPYTDRYDAYCLWKATVYDSAPELVFTKNTAANETRKVLRRISKENFRETGRRLAKVAHSNPIVVFDTLVSQIEFYDNLIQPVVDSFKYLTSFGYDVLSFVVITHLASSHRPKLKEDGTNTSQWLSSLAQFCGVLYRKHPTMELGGLLQCLVSRLKNGQSLDLLVLSQLLTRMGGCETFEDLSERQINGKAGGEVLRAETADMAKPPSKKCINRFRDALLTNKLVVPLLVLIAQQRANILFNTDTKHLKLLGRLYDTCQMTFVQFCEFLCAVIKPAEDYAALLPSLNELVSSYHLDLEVVFQLLRPTFRNSSGSNAQFSPYPPELIAGVTPLVPGEVWQSISPELYLSFWSLSLYDIYNPEACCEEEIKRLKSQYNTLERSTDDDRSAERKRKKEMTRCKETIEKLKKEQISHAAHCKKVFAGLKRAKDSWLEKDITARSHTVITLLQTCVLPRALNSPEDALFCAKFIALMHSMGTRYFSSIQYYDKVARGLTATIFCNTERESANLGLFLRETLQLLTRWYSSKKDYDKEAGNVCGFCVNFSDPSSKKASFEEYKKVFMRWHNKLGAIFLSCLDSEEYMEIRNALIVLRKLAEGSRGGVFPCTVKVWTLLEKLISNITKDERQDLKLNAKSYHSLLIKAKGKLIDADAANSKAQNPGATTLKPSGKSTTKPGKSEPPSKATQKPSKADSKTKETSKSRQATKSDAAETDRKTSESGKSKSKEQSNSKDDRQARQREKEAVAKKMAKESMKATEGQKRSDDTSKATLKEGKSGSGSGSGSDRRGRDSDSNVASRKRDRDRDREPASKKVVSTTVAAPPGRGRRGVVEENRRRQEQQRAERDREDPAGNKQRRVAPTNNQRPAKRSRK